VYWIVLIPWCLHVAGTRIPRSYSRAEKEDALDALATALLLLRDKRVRAHKGMHTPAGSSYDGSGKEAHLSKDGREAAVTGSDDASYDVGLLAELVEQLGNIAPAAERMEYMYGEKDGEEPVTINWSALRAKVTSPLARAQTQATQRSGGSGGKNSSLAETADTEMVAVNRPQV
jgi:hypothetical protein